MKFPVNWEGGVGEEEEEKTERLIGSIRVNPGGLISIY